MTGAWCAVAGLTRGSGRLPEGGVGRESSCRCKDRGREREILAGSRGASVLDAHRQDGVVPAPVVWPVALRPPMPEPP